MDVPLLQRGNSPTALTTPRKVANRSCAIQLRMLSGLNHPTHARSTPQVCESRLAVFAAENNRTHSIPDEEHTMSKQIKNSTVAGGVGAVATTGTAMATASAVSGASAAGIMSATAGSTGAALASLAGASGTAGGAAVASGMATIGSAVGGGMAAGAIIAAAAPVAALAAIGWGLFKLFDD
ncbi:hypothetical protein [Thermomonas fusca]